MNGTYLGRSLGLRAGYGWINGNGWDLFIHVEYLSVALKRLIVRRRFVCEMWMGIEEIEREREKK